MKTTHSAEFLEPEKLQVPIKPKRKSKIKKDQEEQSSVYQQDVLKPLYPDVNLTYNHPDYRDLTPSPQPSTMDDTSRTSSELMLVLVPSNENITSNNKGRIIDLHI